MFINKLGFPLANQFDTFENEASNIYILFDFGILHERKPSAGFFSCVEICLRFLFPFFPCEEDFYPFCWYS